MSKKTLKNNFLTIDALTMNVSQKQLIMTRNLKSCRQQLIEPHFKRTYLPEEGYPKRLACRSQ